MKGVSYITNEKGKKSAVVIDLKQNGSLWEEFYDRWLVENRKTDEKFSLAETKAILQSKGKFLLY